MRLIYSSPRRENIDRVVALLREHGIETTVTNRAVYTRSSYQRFSYSNDRDSEAWPKVWIQHAEDQAPARALMREIGVGPAVRYADALEAERRRRSTPATPRRYPSRIRIVLLAIIAILVLVTIARSLMH